MVNKGIIPVVFFCICVQMPCYAQTALPGLRIFGYFQNQFIYEKSTQRNFKRTSFTMQQLNIFAQKTLSARWTSFINIEMVNNFSSGQGWGQLNLEEAWARYHASEALRLKVGLHIPTFNRLNEIKNKTPLLPYLVRPLVYETSFSDFIPLAEFLPSRAFVQAFGFFSFGESKLDYAISLGNSPNIANQQDNEINNTNKQTGLDTTDTILLTARLGIRTGGLQAGLSFSYDRVNFFKNLAEAFENHTGNLSETPRVRFGADLSYEFNNFSFEAELIEVRYDEEIKGFDINKDFFYVTLGYQISEPLFAYVSYWLTSMHDPFPVIEKTSGKSVIRGFIDVDIIVPTFGAAYNLNDRIIVKAQYTRGLIQAKIPQTEGENFRVIQGVYQRETEEFDYFTAGVSIFF